MRAANYHKYRDEVLPTLACTLHLLITCQEGSEGSGSGGREQSGKIAAMDAGGSRAGSRAEDGAGPKTGARASPDANAGVCVVQAGAGGGGGRMAVNEAPTCGRARQSFVPCRILDSPSQRSLTNMMWHGRSHPLSASGRASLIRCGSTGRAASSPTTPTKRGQKKHVGPPQLEGRGPALAIGPAVKEGRKYHHRPRRLARVGLAARCWPLACRDKEYRRLPQIYEPSYLDVMAGG